MYKIQEIRFVGIGEDCGGTFTTARAEQHDTATLANFSAQRGINYSISFSPYDEHLLSSLVLGHVSSSQLDYVLLFHYDHSAPEDLLRTNNKSGYLRM